MHEHMMNNQEHVKNAYENLRTFKHFQRNLNNYYYTYLKFSSWQHKKQVRKRVEEKKS